MLNPRRISPFLVVLILIFISGCATRPYSSPTPPKKLAHYPIGFHERGIASWYGPGFHGNQTANGERYDMYGVSAAHRTLPMGSMVEVRSLTTGRRVTVRINDRGPFVRGRIIDLSLGAAKALLMTARGTDKVEIKVVGYQGRSGDLGFLRVQVGSFSEKTNAWALKGRLEQRFPNVRVVPVSLFRGKRYRVLVGEFRSERQADAFAVQLAAQLAVDTLVIRDGT